MRLTLITLVLLTLTACTGDPFGTAAAEHERTLAQVQTAQIQADAQTDQARISASTARIRYGGWMVGAMIAGIVAVAVAAIAGMTHIQAQRDRLIYTPEQWRASLPVQPTVQAVTDGRRPGARPMPLLAMTQRRRAPSPTLALPEHSETTRTNAVIDA